MRPSRTSIVVALAAIALVACTEEEPLILPEPTSAFPSPTDATEPSGMTGMPPGPETSGPTGSASTGPTGPTGLATGDLTRGSVNLRVTGDVSSRRELRTLVAGTYTPPPGGLALVWTAGGLDATTVGIGGSSFVGSQPTSPTLSITITVQTSGAGIASFLSMDGGCTVTIERADAGRLDGGFTCRGLEGSLGEVVDATATFSATG